ncbi:MAG: glycosyltransferase family 87 protein [Thermodesulfobacteriota bacterium]
MEKNKTIKKWLYLLLTIGWLALFIKPALLLDRYFFPPHIYLKDFMQEWLMARAVTEGMNPYAPLAELAGYFFSPTPERTGLVLPSPHPPPAILLALPFGLVAYSKAVVLWFLMELACIFTSVYLVAQWWQDRRPGLRHIVFPSLMLLVLAPFWQGLLYGQLSSLLLMLLLLTWRVKRQIPAGLFLGMALSVKFMGWPILLFFLIRKKWRAAGIAVVIPVLANIMAALVIGGGPVSHYYRFVAVFMASVYRCMEWNFSLWTLGWRLFSGMCRPFEQSIGILPLVACDAMAPYASIFILLAVLATGLAMASRSSDRDVSYAVLFCVSAMVTPLAWIHTLVLLLLPLAVALRRLQQSGCPSFPTALWGLLTALLLIPDFTLINFLSRFNISPNFSGPTVVSFWPGLITLLPLAVTLCLMVLVYRSASSGRDASSVANA